MTPPPSYPPSWTPPAECIARLTRRLLCGGRHLIGITGSPGAGKSSLAQALVRALPPHASQWIPMDGFHLANAELSRLGRADRKGAPDTFDSAGFAALLDRLRHQREPEVIYAPEFRREIEEPIAGAIAVLPTTPLIITEGNYLLLEQGGWAHVGRSLDECWFIDAEPESRRHRLVARHRHYGRSLDAALEWVGRSDEANARLVESTRARADAVFRWPADG